MIIRWNVIWICVGCLLVGFVLGVTTGSNAVRMAAEQAYTCDPSTSTMC